MAEPLKIVSDNQIVKGKISVDGKIWDVMLPGAGSELRFSQASRSLKGLSARIELLDKKIDSKTITEDELNQYDVVSDKYNQAEQVIFDIVFTAFKDSTPDNAEVKQWIEETPSAVIFASFQEVYSQANENKETPINP